MKRIFHILLLALLPVTAFAAPEFEEGVQYDPVIPVQPTEAAAGKVEVLEMFWYGCPHCYHLEPLLKEWLANKPDYIEFRRMPALFGENWRLYTQAYYAAEALGVLDKTHTALFERIHKDHKPPKNLDELAAFYAEYGVDEEEFRKAFNSFGVIAKVNRSQEMSKRYGIQGVPAFVVAGKYHTSVTQAGSPETLWQVIDSLAAAEHGQAVAEK